MLVPTVVIGLRRTRLASTVVLVLVLLASHGRTVVTAAPLPGVGIWLPAAAPAREHLEDAAVRLLDGTVLLNGERYDPATDSWQPAPTAPVYWTERALLLPDGRAMVIDGFTGRAALYTPSTATWAIVAGMSSPRLRHTATLLNDGTVLVAGGHDETGTLASAERYDPATNTWLPAGVMTEERILHTATLLDDGRVFVAGGSNRGRADLATAEIYDPTTNTWTSTAPMTASRFEHTATRLPDGRVLVVGGVFLGDPSAVRVERYDPVAGAWQTVADLPVPRSSHTATLLNDGTVMIVGGFALSGYTASVERYDPRVDQWLPTFGMRAKAYGRNATLLTDNTVLVVSQRTAERFDPARPAPQFADVPTDAAAFEAITNLAARNIIRGYGDGTFGPNDRLLRAQIAGIIARGMAWDGETHDNPFPDRGTVDDELWRAVGILAFYNVARGYEDGTYDPTGPVLKVQVVSLVTRAQVARLYWSYRPAAPSVYPNIPESSGARDDLALFVARAGALPDAPADQPWTDWDQPATREWTARVIWQAFTGQNGASR